MLVIVSDLHLTDGTTGKTVAADAFVKFREYVRDLAYSASWRSDGRYRPVERIDLVLLGDIFDLIRSTKWSDEQPGDVNYARPWDDLENSPALIRKLNQITDAILEKNADSFQILRELGGGAPLKRGGTSLKSAWKPLTLPPASVRRRPAPANVKRQPVKVNIYYMTGNHDWFLHVKGPAFDELRQKISAALGLANQPGPFPHAPEESGLLNEVFGQHEVFGRHGDIYDPFNFDKTKGRDAASLGDALVVDLINRFPHEVRQQMGDELPSNFLSGMDELANIRPSLVAPVWINLLISQFNLNRTLGNEVKRIWNDIADDMLALPFIREQDSVSPFDTVDLLETTLRFAKLLSFRSIAELVSWIQERLWGGNLSFAKNAFEEQAFKNRSARYFVYGHTHHYETVPLEVSVRDSKLFEQMYFNSGTWHPLHEITYHKSKQQGFIQYKVLSFISFFKEDERKGRRFETWMGSLDD